MSQHPENCSWIYQARRVNTQSAGGGGALVTRFQLASGQVARLIALVATGPVTNTTLNIFLLDEDGAETTRLATIAAGVSNTTKLPSIGTAANTSGNVANSVGFIIPSGGIIAISTGGAAQTETLTVGVVLELFNDPTIPTWDTTGSAGTPSLAASTISAANTLVAGRMWT